MATQTTLARRLTQWGLRTAVAAGFAAGVVVLLLWLAGAFSAKLPTATAENPAQTPPFHGRTATVRIVVQPRIESASGTVRAVHEIGIGAKLLARVVAIPLKAGQEIHAGDVLTRLDDADLLAKLRQANAAVASAEAVYGQTAADQKRYAELTKTRTVSHEEYEKVDAAFRTAKAELLRTQEAVNEANAALQWATIRSPIDGTVIDKRVEVGDMVTPGQLLVTIYDPKRMQLVANVRESLAHQLALGQQIEVQLEGMGKQCHGTISEIVPEAQPASRTCQIKVTGPCPPNVYSGMFGRVLIPLPEKERVLVIPRQAVRRVGQLELVDVVDAGRVERRAIRLGRAVGDDVETLSGLREGEAVVLPDERQ
jgi:RND family efflux transporter MFP subunit